MEEQKVLIPTKHEREVNIAQIASYVKSAFLILSDHRNNSRMSGFSSFLKPGNTPGAPSTPFNASVSTTPATQPPSAQSQPPVIPGPSFSISSTSSAPSGASAATMKLREIAQQSQKLNETIRAGSAELPKLELSLGMIREKARDMSRRAGGAGRDNMQQAYVPFLVDPNEEITYSRRLD
jgi:hypothetical protein